MIPKLSVNRLVSLLLAVCVTASVLIACSSGAEDGTQPADVETGATEAETGIDRKNAAADLPEKDYQGQNFTVLTTEGMEYEIWAEELNGEVTNDAVYSRNSGIMSEYNITLGYAAEVNWEQVLRAFTTSVNSGDNAYQLLANYAYTSYNAIAAGLCANWTDLEYVDLEKPWWNRLSNDEATINGILYAAVGDFSVSAILHIYAMFFNADLGENWNISLWGMYDRVDSGKWTIDELMSLTKDIYSDADGDGKRSMADIYGYSGYGDDSADMFQIAFDNPITKKDADGLPYCALMTDKIIDVLQKVIDLTHNQTGSYLWNEWRGQAKLFGNGTVVFVPAYFKEAFDKFRFMETEYAILPYPKWDEAQSAYYSGAMDEYTVLMIPFNAPDPEMTGIIAEALTVESYRSVTPAYYDIALKGKYSIDLKTADIVDIIINGRRFDFAFMFGTSKELNWLPYLFRRRVEAKNTDLASEYAKIAETVEAGYKTICGYYQVKP
ncbi:MAG: hypothetical protein PHZ09_08725 [Eubacteriales bacterium]|jgi:hypothetical protein|nr:hypothetical protein [Eubacteriales bacterium]